MTTISGRSNGFDSSTVKSGGGDSGGPWISGNFAVGHAHGGGKTDGGVQTRAIATTPRGRQQARSPAVSSCSCS